MDVQKLKGKIVERGYTRASLAKVMGIYPSTLCRKLKAGDSFTVGEVATIVKELELSPEEATDIFFPESRINATITA